MSVKRNTFSETCYVFLSIFAANIITFCFFRIFVPFLLRSVGEKVENENF